MTAVFYITGTTGQEIVNPKFPWESGRRWKYIVVITQKASRCEGPTGENIVSLERGWHQANTIPLNKSSSQFLPVKIIVRKNGTALHASYCASYYVAPEGGLHNSQLKLMSSWRLVSKGVSRSMWRSSPCISLAKLVPQTHSPPQWILP